MDVVAGLLLFVLLAALYFLPTIIAGTREHMAAGAIFALNLLAGWTALGWLAALVWSLNSNTRENFRYLASGERSRPTDGPGRFVDGAIKPERGAAPVVRTFSHSNVRDGDRLDRDIHYQALVIDEWRKASPQIPGGISATVDGQPCKIVSFTMREHGDDFYANLLLGDDRKTFTIADHQWQVRRRTLSARRDRGDLG